MPFADARFSFLRRCLEVVCRFASHAYTEKQKTMRSEREAKKEARQEGSEAENDTAGAMEDEEEEGDDLDLPPMLHKLFSWLLDHHEVQSNQARLKICLLINGLLKLMGEDASIDDDLYQKIFDNMLERLKDKTDDIRSQAVTALQRLQVRAL
jgi:hypothetical protein